VVKSGTLVVVTWCDIETETNWAVRRKARKRKPPVFKSVGWYLNQDHRALRVYATRSAANDHDLNDVMVFPIGCVLKVKELK
jgi:hypothetical protein